MNRLISSNGFFTDKKGRIFLLRGVNLSGSSKIPYTPDGNTFLDQSKSFQNHKDVSFVGRPFPEEEAKEHFERMQKWGFNFLRFLVTWEAIEHSGPGVYDEEYISYVVRMVALAEKYGFYVFIDPHQDVWSRFTGGDGAPGWTLESIGMDLRKIAQSDTVLLQNVLQDKYKKMSWPLNYEKYPTASMFTLFWGGKYFAPNCKVEGVNIQDYLQDHYIAAMSRLAKALSKAKNVLGFGSMNEPHPGWLGHKDLVKYEGIGGGWIEASSPFEEMCMSEGLTVFVRNYFFLGKFKIPIGKTRLNQKGISLWQNGKECVWKKEGVWTYDPNGAPVLLKQNYFSNVNGKDINFFQDFLKPFITKYKTSIQKVQKQFFIFIEDDPANPDLEWKEEEKKGYMGVVNSTHWYDVVLLFTKRYIEWLAIHPFEQKLVFGKNNVQKMYNESISQIKEISKEKMGNVPTVIGETGIPMDLQNKEGYLKNNYSKHEKALDRIYNVIDKTLVNITLWNYTSDNTHEYGDKWNGEDLSVFSKDTDPSYNSDGGRGVKAFSRPYPTIIDGEPLSLLFDINKALFKFSFQKREGSPAYCQIFVPPIHYKDGIKVQISSGTYTYKKEKNIIEFKGGDDSKIYGITITPA
ncbi:MAG: cellulase family glycosylhydrolase [Leptospiraceae bacterium]|nr:cellulase family glycosylhydrolase [Leptospiraceae bacterium]